MRESTESNNMWIDTKIVRGQWRWPLYGPKKGIFNDTLGMKKDTLYTDMDLLADSPPVENFP